MRTGALETIASRSFVDRVTVLVTLVTVVLVCGMATDSRATSQTECPNAALRVGASAGLSDCRVYEQISPVNKNGFAAYPTTALPAQVSSSGEALAYFNYQAFPGAGGNTIVAAHVSTRTSSGWQTTEWTPKVPQAAVLKLYIAEYTFSSDLTQAIIQVPAMFLTPTATPYVENLFNRDANGAYSLVNSNPPAVSAEEICGPELLTTICWAFADVSGFAGASNDFRHVLFESTAQFTLNAPPTSTESLYENSNGIVKLVGILPDNTPAETSTAGAGSSAYYASPATQADRSVERAVSPDGSHVIFQAPADGGEPDPEQSGMTEVYDRINGTETLEISVPAPGATPAVSTPEGASFQSASVDGSRIFFTSSAELTTSSNTGEANNSEDLYEYNLETKQLTDLTIDTNPADAASGAMVQGVVDSSTDGSYVYFVANGQLVEGKGVDGQPNLYMVHSGAQPVFIATLGSESEECRFIADPCVWSSYPTERQAYVTPDGRHMAFMSSKSLPTVNFPGGYNNTDQESAQADSQIYEYTSPTKPGGTGQLLCASCDPTGAQPVGKAVISMSPGVGGREGKIGYNNLSTPFYRARALSENGRRLFYAAPSSVAKPYPSVYEYEQNGEGTCEDPRGCQILISSPDSSTTDYLLGSNADGSDVYFASSSQFASTDRDNLRDIYDARIDGGVSTPPPETPCASSCQQHIAPPSPVSHVSGLVGPSGNWPSPPATRKCKKSFKLSHGKCVKTKKRKLQRHKRRSKGRTTAIRESRRAR